MKRSVYYILAGVVLILTIVLVVSNIQIKSKILSHTPGTPFLIKSGVAYQNNYLMNEDYFTYIYKNNSNQIQVYKYNLNDDSETALSSTSSNPMFYYDSGIMANSDYVVWCDYRDVDEGEIKLDVYYRETGSSSETKLTSQPEDRAEINILDDYLVYAEYGSSQPGIYVKDLSTSGSPARIHAFTAPQCILLSIGKYNNNYYIAFEDQNGSSSDIKLYNITTQTTSSVAMTSDYEGQPYVQNGYVLYVADSRDDKKDKQTSNASGYLKLFNISNSSTSTVVSTSSDQDISICPNSSNSNLFVFTREDRDGYDFHEHLFAYKTSNSTLYDLDYTQNEMSFIVSSENCDGEKVVYAKEENSPFDFNVYLYDVSSSTKTTISNDSGKVEWKARIKGDTITWDSGTNDLDDIRDGNYSYDCYGYLIQ